MDIITKSLDQKLSEKSHHRITQSQKDAHGKRWYKNRIDEFVTRAFSGLYGQGDSSHYSNMKINYDLFNNILNVKDLMYVTQPYGSKVGESPAKMVNRDIVSTKIKSLIGMELKRPFNWRAIAINEEAITRKQEEENRRNLEFVQAQIMQPIKEAIELKYQEQLQNKQLTTEERSQIQQQIAQETEQQTPDAVRKYMNRSHKDPAEVLNEQILQYLIPNLRIRDKFNKGWKHALLSGVEVYYRGIVNGDPIFKVCNPLMFDCDRSPDYDSIQEGEWAVMKYLMTPSQIVATFGEDLESTEIDEIYSFFPESGNAHSLMSANLDDHQDWSFTDTGGTSTFAMPVYHVEFKSLRKIRFLKYLDNDLGVAETIVNDQYKLNTDAGDITIEEIWIPEVHEGYRVANTDIYLSMRPVPGQHKDLSNLYDCKLSYCGAFYDNLNSVPTAVMDRIKEYQYYYNIIMYRVEKLMASDKGKKVMMNINLVPKSMGIDVDKWLYYADNLDVIWFNPNEEGNKQQGNVSNVGEIAKEIDLSLVSQISQYIELADYIDLKCGQAIGVPKQVEGEITPTDAVTNVKQIIVQSSNVLEPLFEMHNIIKAEALNGLMEVAKVAYASGRPRKLSYILDDMSMHMLDVDQELLDNNTCAIFVANSGKAADVKQTIEALAHAAMQTQTIEMSDVIKVVRTEGISEAEEILEIGEERKRNHIQQQATAAQEMQNQEAEKQRAFEREKWAFDRETELMVQDAKAEDSLLERTVLSAGFAEDKDMNDNNVPDVLEIAQHGLDAAMRQQENNRKDRELDHKIKDDAEKNKLEEKKIAAQKRKSASSK